MTDFNDSERRTARHLRSKYACTSPSPIGDGGVHRAKERGGPATSCPPTRRLGGACAVASPCQVFGQRSAASTVSQVRGPGGTGMPRSMKNFTRLHRRSREGQGRELRLEVSCHAGQARKQPPCLLPRLTRRLKVPRVRHIFVRHEAAGELSPRFSRHFHSIACDALHREQSFHAPGSPVTPKA